MTGGLAWQDEYGLCTSCQQRPPYWGAVCQPCGVALGVGSWADGPNQPQPVGWRTVPAPEQAEPVGIVHMPPGATREQMAEVASGLQYLAARHGTQGGNTAFHTGGVIRAPGGGGGAGINTANCGRCGQPITGPAHQCTRAVVCTVCGGWLDAAGQHDCLPSAIPVRHACCGGLVDRGHTTRCPDPGPIWMETETVRPAWLVIRPPQRHMPARAKARPRRSLGKLAGSVGDSAGVGLLATWISWLVIPGVGYVHAVHLSLVILTAAATILTVAGLCGYGRNSRED